MAVTASYYGANYTVADSTPEMADLLNVNEWSGIVKVQTDTFTAGDGDTGIQASIIYIAKLPKAAVPLMCSISWPAAVTWTGTIGYAGDPDALGDFIAQGAAGSQVTGPSAAVACTPLSEAKDIFITTATAALVSGDSITTNVFYVQGG